MEALKANRGFRDTKGATLSVDPETKRFELSQYAALEDLDPDRLVAMVEDFATTLTTVRGKLNGISQAKWDMRRMLGDLGHDVESSVFTICDTFRFLRGFLVRGARMCYTMNHLIETSESHGGNMTTVTIHAEDAFATALRAYADRLGKSVNQAVKDLLSPVLGLHRDNASERVNQWKAVYGCIPKKEADFVRKAIAAQHVIDEEMWK